MDVRCESEPYVVVFGTRPEAIKLAPVIRLLGQQVHLVHSGQHYSPELAKFIHDDLNLPPLHAQLAIGGVSRGQQIGNGVIELERHLAQLPHVAAVIVQGDTNTALAGALAANSLDLKLVHIEAGLRSHDRAMPEEHNRILVDHLADLLCAPTEIARNNLLSEGIPSSRIAVTGNTIVDAVLQMNSSRADAAALLAENDIHPDEFILATFHRPENVDRPERLRDILKVMADLPRPVLFPVHPRTRAKMTQLSGEAEPSSRVKLIPPLRYREFLGCISAAAAVVTDSGGIQEEASVLKRPVVVVRNSTERPEVLGTFASLVKDVTEIPAALQKMVAGAKERRTQLNRLSSPYGEGDAADKSVAAIRQMTGLALRN